AGKPVALEPYMRTSSARVTLLRYLTRNGRLVLHADVFDRSPISDNDLVSLFLLWRNDRLSETKERNIAYRDWLRLAQFNEGLYSTMATKVITKSAKNPAEFTFAVRSLFNDSFFARELQSVPTLRGA